ncbi:MAG: Intracellular protease 1 [Methanobacterium sp. PtaU1.Bin097]|jgi:protease I|nr:MAG: Intracellular protease 1 [Methanobacterium sp. PtaU1.Bin097]
MAKIGVMIDNFFEDVEYTRPVKAFKDAGHQITNLGIKLSTVKSKKGTATVEIDERIRDSDYNSFDAIFIPGGYSPDNLRGHREAVEFIRNFFHTDKPVFAICHGPQLLITAQLIEGRKVTGWKSIVQDIKNAGAEFLDQEVVEDGNLITSRQPSDIPVFIEACLKKLE